jgi:hypothetical protein
MDLITLDEYKEHEGLKSTSDDVRLTNIITSVSQLVKTYCSNAFLDYFNTDKEDIFTVKYPTNGVQLREGPIVSVSLVEERRTPVEPYTTLVENQDFYVDRVSDLIYRIDGRGFIDWPTGPGAVKVTYRAGYDVIPDDLKLAVFDLVTYYRKDEHKERRQLSGASISNQGTSTIWRNADFPDHIKRVLDLYKQIQV